MIGFVVKEMFANSARLAYIGKERDKESSLADHGVRKYDAETGRFTSCDALWGKYISLTPYQYSANNPVSYKDINGKHLIVVFSGANLLSDNDCAVAGQIIDEIKTYAKDNNIEDLKTLCIPTLQAGGAGNAEAIEFIKSNLTEGEKLIIYGYSAGGISAVNLCYELSKDASFQTVDLLITVDAAFGMFTSDEVLLIPDNVFKNINFYQTTKNWNGSSGNENIPRSSSTKVNNIKKDEYNHKNIDEGTQAEIIKIIEEELK